jgi:hypothetical protein
MPRRYEVVATHTVGLITRRSRVESGSRGCPKGTADVDCLGEGEPLSDDGGELALELAVVHPLKAEEQLLVEHSGDPA